MTDLRIRMALVGTGKIVQDQHLPHLRDNPTFEVVAAASPDANLAGVRMFQTLADLLASDVAIDGVAICTPPQVRYGLAREALSAGKHVLLEKPPGATVSEVQALARIASQARRTLYATWHSRHASGVQPAGRWLQSRQPRRVEIVWREDVRRWHPGQDWIWRAGGLGVFDPGINALSIATALLPPFFVRTADLQFPRNCETPIAARIDFDLEGGGEMTADFDFLQTGPQVWDIRVETSDGRSLQLGDGGSVLEIDGRAVPLPPEREYGDIYDRFAALIVQGESDVDAAPLQQVADIFMLARRHDAAPFHD